MKVISKCLGKEISQIINARITYNRHICNVRLQRLETKMIRKTYCGNANIRQEAVIQIRDILE